MDDDKNDKKKEEIKEEPEVVPKEINDKIKNSVQSFIDSLTGQPERADKLGDCFKKAIGCSEFDEKVQSGMKKVIERHYNSSREKYEKQFEVDMKIILDLSLNSNYTKEDLMSLLPKLVVVPEPVVVQKPVVVQGSKDVPEPVVVPEPVAEPEPFAEYVPTRPTNELTKEEVADKVKQMEKGRVINEELFNELSEDDKKLFEKDNLNYEPYRSSAPILYKKK